MQIDHTLKTYIKFFVAQAEGRKNFEIRSTKDRCFISSQIIKLNMANTDGGLLGTSMLVEITYVLDDFEGIKPGFAILGTKRIKLLNGEYTFTTDTPDDQIFNQMNVKSLIQSAKKVVDKINSAPVKYFHYFSEERESLKRNIKILDEGYE